MARPLRIEFPGALYHVTARGNAREDIVADDVDRQTFIEVLGQVVVRARWLCHVYCLMGNHYHLVIETQGANLSGGMRQLNGVYTQRFNRRHGRVGHVFQGRYGAILVERDAYLLELGRYVVRNPVRARMVRRAEDWPWSSYRATTGLSACPDWLHADGVLGYFGPGRERARQEYARFVSAEEGPNDPWRNLKRQIYLGSDRFVLATQQRVAVDRDLTEIPRVQRSQAAKSLDAYLADGGTRRAAMALAYASGAFSLSEIARHFGVHYSTVSRAVTERERRRRIGSA